MEKEPIPQANKIIIPKEGDIFNMLNEKIESLKKKEEGKEKKKPIEREDFLLRILEDREYFQRKVNSLDNVLTKVFNYEALGMKLKFYELSKSNRYGFDIQKKTKAGFAKKDENI
jgi:hypothetical protein